MWMLLIALIAAGIGLSRVTEVRARLLVLPVVLVLVAYQALTAGLL